MIHKVVDILFICLLIIGCCLVVGFRVHEYSNLSTEHAPKTENNLNAVINYEHAGLACCPCGVCHVTLPDKPKHSSEEDTEEHVVCHHELKSFSFGLRLSSVLTTIVLILAALSI